MFGSRALAASLLAGCSGSGAQGLADSGPAALEISPAGPRELAGSTVQFTASSGGVAAVASWSSSNLSVATIDGQGRASLLGAGTSIISAAAASAQGSTPLTVTTAAAPLFVNQPANANVAARIAPPGVK